MTPNNGQASVRPGQRIIVDLPFNSNVDLSTFTWFYKGQTNHAGAAADGLQGYVQSRFFPRNSASVIQSIQIKLMVVLKLIYQIIILCIICYMITLKEQTH